MTVYNDGTFDYNATIEVSDNEYLVLQPGNYYFIVDRVEFGTFQASPGALKRTIPDGCRTVELYLSIETPQGIAQVRDRFFLHQSVAWRIGAIHKCLGLIPEDEKNLTMSWDQMQGRSGVCKIKNEASKNGNMFNNVDKYIYPSKIANTMNRPIGIPAAPQQPANKYGGLL